jgi:hypothetical protein
MLLAVEGAPTENGTDLVQTPVTSPQNFTWRLNYDGAGYFRVTNESGSKIIDVPDESSEAGTHLHLWDYNGGAHQVWRGEDLGNGDFRIRNKKSGLYIGVVGGSTSAAAAIEQQACGGDEQRWRIQAVQNNSSLGGRRLLDRISSESILRRPRFDRPAFVALLLGLQSRSCRLRWHSIADQPRRSSERSFRAVRRRTRHCWP